MHLLPGVQHIINHVLQDFSLNEPDIFSSYEQSH